MARVCLNLGCGNDYRESNELEKWVNVDNGDCRVDVHMDIENFVEWMQLQPDYFDHIIAIQVLEHVSKENFGRVIHELFRVSKPGATWSIAVPHGFSDNFITDPTHKMPFSLRTFDYFIEGTQLRENGRIYGWGNIYLRHIEPPAIDGNQSIHFNLEVIKDESVGPDIS